MIRPLRSLQLTCLQSSQGASSSSSPSQWHPDQRQRDLSRYKLAGAVFSGPLDPHSLEQYPIPRGAALTFRGWATTFRSGVSHTWDGSSTVSVLWRCRRNLALGISSLWLVGGWTTLFSILVSLASASVDFGLLGVLLSPVVWLWTL